MTVRSISSTDLNALTLLHKAKSGESALIERLAEFGDKKHLHLNFQTCQFPGVVITQLHGTANENGILSADDPEPSVSMNFQLNGSVNSKHVAYGQSFNIQAAQHNILYAKHGAGTHLISKGYVKAVHFRLDLSYYNNWFPENELADRLLERTAYQEAFFANSAMMPITPHMSAALNAISNCPLKGQFKKVYLEAKMLELLALELTQAADYKGVVKVLSSADIRKVHEVRDYLDLHFLLPQSLMQLAKSFGLNDYKLKKGFRDLYQTSVFSYIHEKRMNLALKLLYEKAATVSEVADAIGYKNSNHFSTAFKKFFGFLPGSLL